MRCDVPDCTRGAIWEGVCDHHHLEAQNAYLVGILNEVGRDLKIELWYDQAQAPALAPGMKFKVHALPLVWQSSQGTPYGRAVLRTQARRVIESEPGQRNQALNKAAYVVGGYVAGGQIARPFAIDILMDAAEASGLPLREAESTIRSGLEHGMRRPLTAPR